MKISVTLRATGDCLIPEEITAILGVTPHLSRYKGDVRTLSSGKEIVSKFGFWNWKSDDLSGTLTINDHIGLLHSALGHAYSSLNSLPNAENVWIDICIVKDEAQPGDSAVEFTLNVNSMGILHDFGLPTEFTFY